jgi:hypothetical protein
VEVTAVEEDSTAAVAEEGFTGVEVSAPEAVLRS